MIFVQRIVTTWSKCSRGAPHASKRNAVPALLPLPTSLESTDATALAVQTLQFLEFNAFHQPVANFKEYPSKEAHLLDEVTLRSLAGKLAIVLYKTTPPNSIRKPVQLFELEANQWGRVVYNERSAHNCDGD